MTTASAGPVPRRRRTRVAFFVLFFLGLLVLWEVVKFIGGDPWRMDGRLIWDPPLKIAMASDINMPHIWLIFGRLTSLMLA